MAQRRLALRFNTGDACAAWQFSWAMQKRGGVVKKLGLLTFFVVLDLPIALVAFILVTVYGFLAGRLTSALTAFRGRFCGMIAERVRLSRRLA